MRALVVSREPVCGTRFVEDAGDQERGVIYGPDLTTKEAKSFCAGYQFALYDDAERSFGRLRRALVTIVRRLGADQGIIAPMTSWGDSMDLPEVAEALEIEAGRPRLSGEVPP